MLLSMLNQIQNSEIEEQNFNNEKLWRKMLLLDDFKFVRVTH